MQFRGIRDGKWFSKMVKALGGSFMSPGYTFSAKERDPDPSLASAGENRAIEESEPTFAAF